MEQVIEVQNSGNKEKKESIVWKQFWSLRLILLEHHSLKIKREILDQYTVIIRNQSTVTHPTTKCSDEELETKIYKVLKVGVKREANNSSKIKHFIMK